MSEIDEPGPETETANATRTRLAVVAHAARNGRRTVDSSTAAAENRRR